MDTVVSVADVEVSEKDENVSQIANTTLTINNGIVKIASVDPNLPPKSIYLGGCCWYDKYLLL